MSKQRSSKRPFPVVEGGAEENTAVSYSVGFDLSRFRGTTLVVGDTVFLSDEGVQVLASTTGSYTSLNAYSFIDSDGNEIGGMYARDDEGANVIGFRATDTAAEGEDVTVNITAEGTGSAAALLNFTAVRSGESVDTSITLERSGSTSRIDLAAAANGRIRLSPAINLLGPDLDQCDLYIKGSNLIIKYSDGGTPRYKYLDLAGTSAVWAASAEEPQ